MISCGVWGGGDGDVVGTGAVLTLGTCITGAGAMELGAPFASETALDETSGCGVDVSDGFVFDQGFEDSNNLWAFIGHMAKLCLCEKGVENAEICMSKLYGQKDKIRFQSICGREKRTDSFS